MNSANPAYLLPLLGPFGPSGYLLGRDGSLTALLSIDGRDPDGLADTDFAATSLVFRNALAHLPSGLRFQQYYLHTLAALPTPRSREHPVIDALQAARHAHLSRKVLFRSRVYCALTLPSHALTSRVSLIELVALLLLSPVDRGARLRLSKALRAPGQLTYLTDVLGDAERVLGDAVAAFRRRWSIYGDSEVLDVTRSWGFVRFLASLDPAALDDAHDAPADHWYGAALHGAVRACSYGGLEYLMSEHRERCARLASVVRIAGRVQPGLWCRSEPNLLSLGGEFMLASTSAPLSGVQRSLRFAGLRNELRRRDVDLLRSLSQRSDTQHEIQRVPTPEELELKVAEGLDEPWYHTHIVAAALGSAPDQVKETALGLDHALAQASIVPVWETPGLLPAFRAVQLGAAPYGARAILCNASQLGAAAQAYRHSQGVSAVADLGGEEPLIWLETIDGQPFGFSPFVGEKSTVLGLGASRSGKTFAKNALAAAWPKWGGHLVTMDYDMGSDCLAALYGEDAALFSGAQGLNPFAAPVSSVNAFRAHLTRLTMSILASNDDGALRELDRGEQALMDAATDSVLALPEALRTLSAWVRHLPSATGAKLSRWVHSAGGRYADLLDAPSDSVGLINRLVTVFNLAHLRDDDTARGPVLLELLWRVASAFEDPSRLLKPKKLVIDEAHYSMRGRASIADVLVTKARTWAKYRASLELWTHIPSNYGDMPDWEALRSSASTFMFTATPDADFSAYREVFGLTEGDVATIRAMVPKRDLYVVQPDTGLRKRLVLDPDPDMLQWASSTAAVVAARAVAPSFPRAVGA